MSTIRNSIELAVTTLDRLGDGEDFNQVIEDLGTTARLCESLAQLRAAEAAEKLASRAQILERALTRIAHLAASTHGRNGSSPAAIVGKIATLANTALRGPSFLVYIRAQAATQDEAHPAFARLKVDLAFITRLGQLHALCLERGLSEIRVDDLPDAWGPDDSGEELQLDGCELVVTPHLFWFRASVQHSVHDVETVGQPVEASLALFALNTDDQMLILDEPYLDADLVAAMRADFAAVAGELVE